MESNWLQAVRLIGLDIVVVLIMILFALDAAGLLFRRWRARDRVHAAGAESVRPDKTADAAVQAVAGDVELPRPRWLWRLRG